MAQFAAATQRSAIGPAKLAAAFAAVLLLCLAALQLQPTYKKGLAPIGAQPARLAVARLSDDACDCSSCEGGGNGSARLPAATPEGQGDGALGAEATCPPCPKDGEQPKCPDPPECPKAAAGAAPAGGGTELKQYKEDVVKRLWEYDPFLSPRSLRQGLYSVGEPSRMRRFVHKLLSGEPVSVSAVGGSVTAGQGALHGGPYQTRWQEFLKKVSPDAKHTLKNPAFGGSTSGIFTVCVNDMVQEDADLVVIEFSINDAPGTAGNFKEPLRLGMERMVRKLLMLKNRPAVIFLNHYAWFVAGGGGEKIANYVSNAENDFNVIGQYYGLPSLSIRAAAYHLMVKNATGYMSHVVRRQHEEETQEDDLYYYDEVHPQDRTGHKALADLLIYLTQETARGLAARPLGDEDEEISKEDLPLPMTPGNYQRKSSTCLLQLAFEKVVVANEGFEWKNERPAANLANEKWGWISEKAGSWAELEVDTTTDLQGDLQSETNEVVLTYLKSYEKMGKAKVECVSGCTCEPTEFDSYWKDEKSLTELHRFPATQHEQCRLRVTVLDESSAPDNGRKVKLVGIMVIEGGGRVDALGIQLDLFANRAVDDK